MTAEQQTKLIEAAKDLIGTPYRYGVKPEEAPRFFDCSLFIQYLFKTYTDIVLPRSTIEQAEFITKTIPNTDALQPGDIIFLHGTRGHYNKTFPEGIGHVVIYIGNNEVIHASSRRVQKQPIIEEGQVRINTLQDIIDRSGPITTIRRIAN